jgi:hypothetical protein
MNTYNIKTIVLSSNGDGISVGILLEKDKQEIVTDE